MLDLFLRCR